MATNHADELKQISDGNDLSAWFRKNNVSGANAGLLVQLQLLAAQEAGTKATNELIAVEKK